MDMVFQESLTGAAPPMRPTAFFTIQVVWVRGVRNSDQPPTHTIPTPELDCHINIMRAGNLIGTTNVIADSPQPMWSEEFDVTEYNQGEELEFKVYAKGGTEANYLGGVTMKPEQFATDGFNDDMLLEETGANNQAYLRLKIKPQGRHYLADPPSIFTVEVEKGENENYGLVLDGSDGKYLMVWGFDAGAFADYNKSAEPSKQLMKWDFIVSVNEASSLADCVKQFRKSKVTCVVMRGFEFSCILERENLQTPLGLTFPVDKRQGIGLPIVSFSVTEGPAKEYNDKCTKEWEKLRVYDRITGVAGERGQPHDLKAKMQNATGKFQVQILRAREVTKIFC